MDKIKYIFELKEKFNKPYFYYEYADYDKNMAYESLPKQERSVLKVLSLQNDNDLYNLLSTDILTLEHLINYPKYKKYFINKKRGGKREILAPSDKLKLLQKRLNSYLQQYYSFVKPDFVYGFTINDSGDNDYCNIRENAAVHIGQKHILNIDLKDFFPSIKASRVKKLFAGKYFQFPERISVGLALLCTFEGKLPTGAPTSPVLSNFICYDLDVSLARLCKQNKINYSRYADDLSFSGNDRFTDELISSIIELIEQYDFQINKNKIYLRSSGQKQTVTGLTVNQKVNVNRKMLKKIRAMLFDFKNNGAEIATKNHFKSDFTPAESVIYKFINKLEGYVNFIGQVRGKTDSVYLKMKAQFEEAFEEFRDCSSNA